MAATAFDTLDAARRLKAAGIEAGHAEAIVGVMGQSVSQTVTVEHFDAGVASLRTELCARMDVGHAELRARIEAVETKMWRVHLVSVGTIVAALALATTILGIIITQGGGV